MAWYDDLNQGISQPTSRPGSVEELRYSMQAQTPKTTAKTKNWMTDQLSTAGGIGGSLGGAAIGTAVLPGIGTIIGGILGGALGSGTGEAVENIATGEKDILKNVGTEALLGGAFGTPILRSGKALYQGGKVLASGAGKTAANAAVLKTLGAKTIGTGIKGGVSGSLKQKATSTLGEAWGIRPGVKLSGKLVTPQSATNLQKFAVDKIGVGKLDNATRLFSKTVDYLDNVGSSIDDAVKVIPNTAINTKNISNSLKNKFNSMIGVDSNSQVATDIIKRINVAKSPSELWALRKEIDTNLIGWNANPESAIPGATQIAKAARAEISNALKTANPALKSLNSQYSKALDVIDLSAAASKTPKGIKVPGVLGSIGGNTTQSVKAGVGNLMNTAAGRVSSITGQIPQELVGATMRQAGGRALIGQPATLDEAVMQQSSTDTPWYKSPTTTAATTGEISSPYPKEALMYDMQRDPTNAEKYIDYYNQIENIYGSTTDTKLSEAQQARVDVKDLIGQSIGMLSSGNVKSGIIAGPLEQLKSRVGMADQPTLDFNTTISNLKATIAKARAGTSFTSGEKKMLEEYTPNVGDSEQQLATKLMLLQRMFGGEIPNVSSLQDSLIQQSQGY